MANWLVKDHDYCCRGSRHWNYNTSTLSAKFMHLYYLPSPRKHLFQLLIYCNLLSLVNINRYIKFSRKIAKSCWNVLERLTKRKKFASLLKCPIITRLKIKMFLLHQTGYLHQCVLQTTLYMAELHQRHTKRKGLCKSNTEENKEIQKGGEKRASEWRIRGNPTKHQLN